MKRFCPSVIVEKVIAAVQSELNCPHVQKFVDRLLTNNQCSKLFLMNKDY